MRPQRLATSKQILFFATVIALTSVIVHSAEVGPANEASQSIKSPEVATVNDKVQQAPSKQEQPAAEAKSSDTEAKHDAPSVVQPESVETGETVKRKGRADQASAAAASGESAAKTEASKAAKDDTKTAKDSNESKSTDKAAPAQTKGAKSSTSSSSSKSATKSKLPPNLGTVTSTGSGGPAHYMSKHDAYSAIAEKHGALAHSAMKKADKRQLHNFGGIQKASGGIGDMLSPFKGVTDSGLARTLGASMRSIMKSKYSVPAYVASALLGAVALMAFYESPISPLPVPPLPEPPIGRFPPELPSLPVGTQVPFRTNQQQQYNQNYNQRSYNLQQPAQASQILFPSNGQQAAQQRQMNGSPVQQLAANILSVGQKQNAQRKSGLDYDQASSRSFFGQASGGQQSPVGAPLNQNQKSAGSSGSIASFLSFFGLNGDASSVSTPVSTNTIEAKGNNGAINSNNLSGSHLINKVRSVLSRSPASSGASSASASISSANSNSWDQYQKMSLMQALMKDAAFLPGYLTASRKSSSAGPQPASSPSKAAAVAPPSQPPSASMPPTSRMQVVGGDLPMTYNPFLAQAQAPIAAPKPAQKSGTGLVKAFIDTLASGIMQRHSSPSAGQQFDAGKSTGGDQISPLSFLTDIMTSNSASAPEQSQDNSKAAQTNGIQQQAQSTTAQVQIQSGKTDQMAARSLEVGPQESSVETPANPVEQKQPAVAENKHQAAPVSQAVNQQDSSAQHQQHVRKTRSIGLEYPIESNQALELKGQQPSKAAQINGLIDYVSESYSQNKLFFNFMMNQVGLSQAVPYVEQILGSEDSHRRNLI